jgi:hypothetical protein
MWKASILDRIGKWNLNPVSACKTIEIGLIPVLSLEAVAVKT